MNKINYQNYEENTVKIITNDLLECLEISNKDDLSECLEINDNAIINNDDDDSFYNQYDQSLYEPYANLSIYAMTLTLMHGQPLKFSS